MNDSERVAADYRQAVYDQLVSDMRPSTAKDNGPGGSGGGGIGNLAGWVTFFGMIGAIFGGILGQGLMGAIVGGVFCGGAMWGLGRFVGRGNGTSRTSVIKSVVLGAICGVLIAVAVSLEYPDRLENLLTNWVLLGSLGGGVYGLVRRARG